MKSLRKDNFFGKIMNNFLYKNKMFMGGGISLILTVLTLFLVTSCNNIIQVQEENKSASLVVTVPGSRAASDNIKSYKVAVIGADEKEVAAKDVGVGGTASFEEMTPGDYTVVVEGYDSENIVIFKGEEKATVVAGESAKVVIKLEGAGFTVILDSNIDGQNPVPYTIKYGEKLPDPVHSKGEGYILLGWTEEKDGSGTLYGANATVMFTKETPLYAQWAVITFEKLQSEINSGNTPILIGESFEVTQPVTIGNSVELRAAGKDVVLTAGDSFGSATDTSAGAMFSIESSDTSSQTSFTVTIGSGDYSLTLDGNSHKISGIAVNSSDATVDLMEKSIITKFGGMGVDISAGTVNLKGGNIKANTGDGVYVREGGIFTMSGSALVQDSVVRLGSNATITVSGELTGTVPVATITPATYSTDTQVLKAAEGVTLANEVGKFEVTPVTDASGTTIEYDINGEGKLCIPVTDEASLKAALDAGGTVSVSSEISVTTGLTVSKDVTLVAASGGAKIINNISTDETTTATPLFTISTGGTLTLGDGINSLTLDGGEVAQHVVDILSGGTVTMKDNVTITSAADSGVNVAGTFNMGGSATLNGGRVSLADGKFITLTSPLTSGSGTNPVAIITPATYSTDTQVLKAAEGVTLENEVGKFAVTPKTDASGTIEYYINGEGKLCILVTDEISLQAALDVGGTVAVSGNITVTTGLTVTNNVTLVAASGGATIINNTSSDALSPLFTVKNADDGTQGSLTLGDGSNSLTLDGGNKEAYGVEVTGGELVMKDNVTIQNAGDSGIYISYGTFTMEGGTISNNTATSNVGGVHIFEGATFDMKGGIITGNTGVNGNGVFVAGQFLMSGNAIVENNDVKLSGDAVITVSGELTGTTTPVATITPSDYERTTAVVSVASDSNVILADVVGRFAVTPVTNTDGTTTTNYTINTEGGLVLLATDETSLKAALTTGGTIYVRGNIEASNLTVTNTVTLVADSEEATITNTSDSNPLFTIQANSTGASSGTLTLGEEQNSNSLILDGGGKAVNVVLVESGELVMKDKATIQNAADSGVRLEGGTFNMEGGTISNNTASTDGGGGVYVLFGATFNMTGGIITDNRVEGNAVGTGVYVANSNSSDYATFTMSGDAVVDSSNDVYLNGDATITVSGELTGTTIPVATITPARYVSEDGSPIQVLKMGADVTDVTLADVVSRFAVTPQTTTSGDTSYTVDENGMLVAGNTVVTTFAQLQNAITNGGTVNVSGNIEVASGLTVSNEVILVGVGEGAKLTNTSSAAMFTVSSGGSLTLGDGSNSLTLDGGQVKKYVVSISSGGTVSMKDKVTITNAADSGVYVAGILNMEGGTITKNISTTSGGGVYISGTFNMTGGSITNNTSSSDGGGVYIGTSGTFSMMGGEVTGNSAEDNGQEVYVASSSASNKGTFEMGGTATLKGGEVYLDNRTSDVSIRLISTLTNGSAENPVASIDIENTNAGSPYNRVLTKEGNDVTLANEVGKFKMNRPNFGIANNEYYAWYK